MFPAFDDGTHAVVGGFPGHRVEAGGGAVSGEVFQPFADERCKGFRPVVPDAGNLFHEELFRAVPFQAVDGFVEPLVAHGVIRADDEEGGTVGDSGAARFGAARDRAEAAEWLPRLRIVFQVVGDRVRTGGEAGQDHGFRIGHSGVAQNLQGVKGDLRVEIPAGADFEQPFFLVFVMVVVGGDDDEIFRAGDPPPVLPVSGAAGFIYLIINSLISL